MRGVIGYQFPVIASDHVTGSSFKEDQVLVVILEAEKHEWAVEPGMGSSPERHHSYRHPRPGGQVEQVPQLAPHDSRTADRPV
jgi:hypothetical protein